VVGGFEVTLIIHGHYYIYLVEPGKTHLHTLDEHGNKIGWSCFTLDEPLEPARKLFWPRTWKKPEED